MTQSDPLGRIKAGRRRNWLAELSVLVLVVVILAVLLQGPQTKLANTTSTPAAEQR
jgi:hypothetical protein